MSSLAGSFLVARPLLRDPNFARTVVLLLAHNDDGAFGLVVNQPADVPGLPWPLFSGGPCPAPGLILLHGYPEWVEAGEAEAGAAQTVAPGVFLGDASCLEKANELSDDGAARFRVFRGYSGWGGGQLEGELAAGAWAVVPATAELVFDTPPDELWDRLAPPMIPEPSVN
ncbi:MAG TPA: YqgE/AlgH family protein [Gemmataceae bacterium]|nr:YqgE/AlgH family protein [Gemmataceae bacterium]